MDEIATTTRIKRDQLEALERNDLTGWPRGVYARAWIRAYANAIGFDPIDTVDEFCRLFPQGDRRAGPTIGEIAAIVAAPSEYRDESPQLAEGDRRVTGAPANMPARPGARERIIRIVRIVRNVRVVPVRFVRTLLRTTRMF